MKKENIYMKKITQEKYKHAKSNITMYEDSIKYQKEEIIKINNDLYMAKERLKMYEDALKRNQKIVNTYKCSLTKQDNKTEKRIKLQSEKINEIKFFCGIGYIVALVFSACLIKMCFL